MDPEPTTDRGGDRILVYAPIGRDAELTRDLLARAALPCILCGSVAEMCAVFEEQGGGALLLTEEALDDLTFDALIDTLERQPPWSDVPVLLFAGSAGQDVTDRTINSTETLRNVTLLERPIGLAAVLTTIRAALRSRARQYEVRDLLVALHRARADAESANRLKDEFLATLSHELRTPLNAILGWTSMLTRGQIGAGRMRHVFEALDRNAQVQAQLIGDVLDISRIVTGKLQLALTTLDASEVMARALDTMRPAATVRDLRLVVEAKPECYVRGDVDRMQQVYWNLLSNAVKFTPPGGCIRITVDRDDTSVAVTVLDTGVGIAPEFLPLVFDRFRQADQSMARAHGGLGLGLAIVKHLVELHGGTVTASSDGTGHGASFRVLIPAAARPAERAVARPDRSDADVVLTGRSILVVDDDASTRDVVATALANAGASVGLAESATEGWASVQRDLPDLIVADLGMPTEDGFSFIRRVRQLVPHSEQLPAIALSAYADAASQQAALSAGFTAFVAKPARPQALLKTIESLLASSTAHPRA
jgi:signal transduction histidine kinase/ActR/RegA family two-component response regulator